MTKVFGVLVVLAFVATAVLASEPMVPRVLKTAEQGQLQVKILEGPAGTLIDVRSKSETSYAVSVTSLPAGKDITAAVSARKPVVEIFYVLSGLDEKTQCRVKLALDTVLGVLPGLRPAYVEKRNDLCQELGFKAPLNAWAEGYSLKVGYSRVLMIEVVHGNSSGDAAALPDFLWNRAVFPLALLKDKAAFVRQVSGFVAENLEGEWQLVPAEAVPVERPLEISISQKGLPPVVLHTGHVPWKVSLDHYLSRITTIGPDAISVGVMGFGGLAAFFFLGRVASRRRLGEPVCEISVGYGSKRDYSIGAGKDVDVAHVVLFRSGAMHLLRKSTEHPLLVNGKKVKRRASIQPSDTIVIGPTRFRFN